MINTLIVQPLLNLLIVLYSAVPGNDFGVAVILLTILVRIILWPLAAKALHSQKAIKQIQPEIDALKKKHKDQQELSKALLELYKEKEVNPFGSCLPSIAQIPFMIGLFYAFMKLKDPAFLDLREASSGIQSFLYPYVKELSFVKNALGSAEVLNTTFLGSIDLAKVSIPLAVVAGLAQFFQSKMMMPDNPQDQAQKMMSRMIYLFPILTISFGVIMPAALPLYWLATTLVAILQQYLVTNKDVEVLEHPKKK